jgi:DHA1 family multidrug resistance protein-like MFS transporter
VRKSHKKAFFALCSVIFTTQLGMSIVSPFMGIYAKTMGASAFCLGIMFSGMPLAFTLFAPVSGWLSDRYSRKSMMVAGLTAYTLISIGYNFSPNVIVLTLIRLFHGVAAAAVGPVAQAYVGDLTPKGREGTFMNIFMMFMYLGMAAGPIMGGLLNDHFGMKYAFYSMGGLSAFSLLFLIFFIPRIASTATAKKKPGLSSMMSVAKDYRIVASTLHLFSRAVLRQGITAFLPVYAVTSLGMSATDIGLVLSLYVFVEAVSQGVMGPIADRVNKGALLIGGTLASAILSFFLGNMRTQWTLLLILIPIAFTTSLARAVASVFHIQVGRESNNIGASMGILNASQGFGGAVGPMLYGAVTETFGLESMFLTGGLTGVIVIPFMLFFLLRQKRQPAPAAITVELEEVKEAK